LTPATPWQVDVLTLFPEMVTGYLSESILGKAAQRGLVSFSAHDIRAYAEGKHHVTDDAPYGGGAGMVFKPEPLVAAIEAARKRLPGARVLLTSPRGERLDQPMARALAEAPTDLILVCGRYEGVDERVRAFVDGEVSLGDFILTGGELVALSVIDAVARLLPGVLGNLGSTASESFEGGLLEYPALHPAAGFSRGGGALRPAERRPCPRRSLAPLAGAALDAAPKAGPPRPGRTQPGGPAAPGPHRGRAVGGPALSPQPGLAGAP
jgi:tRNA (guanine37-N1)-methyltransferase